ncbi:MAG: cysteine desulfurase [Bacteroidetes Order II. Incertae sedis bacterium]|jgi:cysteine desulfurase / selenocysteine lyase|nr:cysteine desulfurase [Bacteroidetes Order II. bacterium]MBT4053165.1 cysteine desulfurase [Bacteroidetes Order II. bacterium]MBT4603236.1 cysteine desulfurase [Bacteroidetes Order II. bacterium]MBT5250924.1 cysteine desulfurase [Bacteroidetes Order II. bacterium]MBT6201185.1 cysteine desulfurase [Bacteroidetes Order II. bacterium]
MQDSQNPGPRSLESIRADFPALHQEVNGQPLVYLDNAATAQKPRAVLDAISNYYERDNANVHRGVHTLSQRATDAYEGARERIARFLGASSSREIIFTKGTTDAINLVASSFGGSKLGPGDEVLISEMEHHANIVPWQLLCERIGAVLKVVPVSAEGDLIYEEFQLMLTERTKLVSLVHVSNSLGTINPVRQIIADAHSMGIPVMLDGAQAIPHGRVNVSDLDVDFYCFSSHKLFGPTGFGVLYGKASLLEDMPPYQGGGDMIEEVDFEGTTFNEIPHKFEAGTPHMAGAIATAAAIEYVEEVGFDFVAKQELELLAYATNKLKSIEGIRIIGEAKEKASVISFLVGSSHPYDVGTILDKMGIAVRTGHHCTQPLMKRFGVPGTVRASFAFYNTRAEVDRLAEALVRVSGMLS